MKTKKHSKERKDKIVMLTSVKKFKRNKNLETLGGVFKKW